MTSTVRFRVASTAFAVLAFALSGCASAKWLTDYDAAQKKALAQNKNIFLLISGDMEESDAAALRKNVFDTEDLSRGLAKNRLVAVNIDFSEARYDEAEKAGEGSKAETALLRDFEVAQRYNVETVPTAYLLTKQGYVIDTVIIGDSVTSAADLLALINEKAGRAGEVHTRLAAIDAAGGLEKIKIIDAFFEDTPASYRSLLGPLVRVVPALDPGNESGVVGKYILQISYLDATAAMEKGDSDGAIAAFKTAAEHSLLNPEEKQEALFTLAFFTAQSGADLKSVQAYLQQAYDAAPKSERASSIKDVMKDLAAEQ